MPRRGAGLACSGWIRRRILAREEHSALFARQRNGAKRCRTHRAGLAADSSRFSNALLITVFLIVCAGADWFCGVFLILNEANPHAERLLVRIRKCSPRLECIFSGLQCSNVLKRYF